MAPTAMWRSLVLGVFFLQQVSGMDSLWPTTPELLRILTGGADYQQLACAWTCRKPWGDSFRCWRALLLQVHEGGHSKPPGRAFHFPSGGRQRFSFNPVRRRTHSSGEGRSRPRTLLSPRCLDFRLAFSVGGHIAHRKPGTV